MKTKINMGRWNELDDKLLARIIIEGVRNGSTQTQEFERAGYALNRTAKACAFRWNKTLRPEYKDAFRQAVKEHRFNTRKVRSMRVPNIAVVVPKGEEPTVQVLPPFGMPVGTYSEPDTRYNEPKSLPTVDEEEITKVINETEIYRRAKTLINTAQRTQVAYGIQKYPNPLNADTWSTVETIDHIISESIDKLHYLVMLRIKLEQQGE